MKHRSDDNGQPLTGQLLLADFQTAFVSTATVETAKYEAERSEGNLMDYLADVSSGGLLNPTTISDSSQTIITRASLDAHIKKVQAQQMEALGNTELQRLMEADQSLYRGHKIRVTALPRSPNAFASMWFDNQTGFRRGELKKGQVTGVIDNVLLDKNTLLLRPTRIMRLINPSLHYYVISVINPETLLPMVEFALL